MTISGVPSRFDLEAQTDLASLNRITNEIASLEDDLASVVARLRDRWVPWSAIAEELGISTQGAQQRYSGKA